MMPNTKRWHLGCGGHLGCIDLVDMINLSLQRFKLPRKMTKGPDVCGNNILSKEEKQFFEAAKENRLQEVASLLRDVDVNMCEEDGMTALMHAAYKGEIEQD